MDRDPKDINILSVLFASPPTTPEEATKLLKSYHQGEAELPGNQEEQAMVYGALSDLAIQGMGEAHRGDVKRSQRELGQRRRYHPRRH